MLAVRVQHRFADFALDVDFAAPPGVTAIFGRSGAGKTTIVKAVAGLLRPDAGRVVVGGSVLLDRQRRVNVPAHRRRIGFVFQDGRLFPHLSVRQNLGYGRWFAPRREDGASFAQVVEMLGIGHLLDRHPAGLSGGERSRVGIGRALLAKPRLLILDEPMAALDAQRRAEILPYLEAVRDHAAVPILYISHSMAEVARLATTLVLIDDGRVAAAGPIAQILSAPQAAASLDPMDAGAVFSGEVTAIEADGLLRLAVDGGTLLIAGSTRPLGHRARIRIRPQDVILSLSRPEQTSALNILPVQVTELLPQGSTCLVQLKLGDNARLLARVTGRSVTALGLRPGLPCFATVKSAALGE